MKLGITFKLFFAIFIAASVAVVSSTLFMQWNLDKDFPQLMNEMEEGGMSRLASRLEDEYLQANGWGALTLDLLKWQEMVESSFPGLGPTSPHDRSFLTMPNIERRNRLPRPRMFPPHVAHQFTERFFLLDSSKAILIGLDGGNAEAKVIPLRSQDRIIGYLGINPQNSIDNLIHRGFLHKQRFAFAIIAAFVLLMSAGLAFLLATRLVSPIKKIAEATHNLAHGGYSVRVPVASSDELGRLASDFNSLALAMEHNEGARRRWVADISHELRTPLTFLRSQVEAILEGVRETNSDSIKAIHREVMRFSRLVDDLYQLAMSDVGAQTYQKDEVKLQEIILQAVSIIRAEFTAKNVTLHCEGFEKITLVHGDQERLRQLFSNLLENSLKYSDSGGELRINISNQSGRVSVDFQDSAPGVPETDLDKMFERLYRVESSRSRATGGAGLGLAICRNIVLAHEGTITAKPSPLGGVWIQIEMPSFRTGKV